MKCSFAALIVVICVHFQAASASDFSRAQSSIEYTKVIVQFADAEGVRLRNQQFVTLNPPPPNVDVQLTQVNALVLQTSQALSSALVIARVLSRTETDIDEERAALCRLVV
jgi:hypothetical protein